MGRGVFGFCGEGGIRTLGTVARTHDFQSCTFGHSVTSPGCPCQTHWAGGFSESAESFVPGRGRSWSGAEAPPPFAERVGFEPTVPLRVRLISNQVPSAARSSLRGGI
jgi:hypothetical protein